MLRVTLISAICFAVAACAGGLSKSVKDQPVCNQLLVDGWNEQSERDHHFTRVNRAQFEFIECLKDQSVLPQQSGWMDWGEDFRSYEATYHARILAYFELENVDLSGEWFFYDGPRSSTLRRVVSDEFREQFPESTRLYFVNFIIDELDDHLRYDLDRLEQHKQSVSKLDQGQASRQKFYSTFFRRYWASLGRGALREPVKEESTFCEIMRGLKEREALAELTDYSPTVGSNDWQGCL